MEEKPNLRRSARAREVDPNIPMLVFCTEELDQELLKEGKYSSLPTGMDKEEEKEIHLKAAIKARQNPTTAVPSSIPIPNITEIDAERYENLYRNTFSPADTEYITTQDLDGPDVEEQVEFDYDAGSDDEEWLSAESGVKIDDFEKIMAILIVNNARDLDSLPDAARLHMDKFSRSLVKKVHKFWLDRETTPRKVVSGYMDRTTLNETHAYKIFRPLPPKVEKKKRGRPPRSLLLETSFPVNSSPTLARRSTRTFGSQTQGLRSTERKPTLTQRRNTGRIPRNRAATVAPSLPASSRPFSSSDIRNLSTELKPGTSTLTSSSLASVPSGSTSPNENIQQPQRKKGRPRKNPLAGNAAASEPRRANSGYRKKSDVHAIIKNEVPEHADGEFTAVFLVAPVPARKRAKMSSVSSSNKESDNVAVKVNRILDRAATTISSLRNEQPKKTRAPKHAGHDSTATPRRQLKSAQKRGRASTVIPPKTESNNVAVKVNRILACAATSISSVRNEQPKMTRAPKQAGQESTATPRRQPKSAQKRGRASTFIPPKAAPDNAGSRRSIRLSRASSVFPSVHNGQLEESNLNNVPTSSNFGPPQRNKMADASGLNVIPVAEENGHTGRKNATVSKVPPNVKNPTRGEDNWLSQPFDIEGQFAFKRRRGCLYRAALPLDCSKLISKSSQPSNKVTTVRDPHSAPLRSRETTDSSVALSRRVGRGGRVVFERVRHAVKVDSPLRSSKVSDPFDDVFVESPSLLVKNLHFGNYYANRVTAVFNQDGQKDSEGSVSSGIHENASYSSVNRQIS